MAYEAEWKAFADKVAAATAEFFGIPAPRLEMRRAPRGHAWPAQNFITIPWWAVNNGHHYFTAYVVHEVTHIFRHHITRQTWRAEAQHGPEFHRSERGALAHFGLEPIYARAYIKGLKFNGQTVYVKAKVRAVTAAAPRPRKKTALEIILED